MKKIISYIAFCRYFPQVIIFLFFKENLVDDIKRCEEHHNIKLEGIKGVLYLLTFDKAFRALFYYRIGKIGHVLKPLAPSFDSLMVNSNMPIGKAALFVHSFSTIINAKSIGENFRITHCCTVGNGEKGKPVIKDNVTIHAGAIVFGGITVGDNVIIGAGTVVNKSIPDNSTVIGNPAYIIKKDGKKVSIKL